MIRLSKMADYGIVLLSVLSGQSPPAASARELADASRLPLPTVHKVLKALRRAGLIASVRGAHGGYRLARPPEDVAVAEIIAALEGPLAITACSPSASDGCALEDDCPVRQRWQHIDAVVNGALHNLSLSDMRRPPRAPPGPRATAAARSLP